MLVQFSSHNENGIKVKVSKKNPNVLSFLRTRLGTRTMHALVDTLRGGRQPPQTLQGELPYQWVQMVGFS